MNPLVILLIIVISVVVLSITLYFIGVSTPKSSNSGMQGLNTQANISRCPNGYCTQQSDCPRGQRCNINSGCCSGPQ